MFKDTSYLTSVEYWFSACWERYYRGSGVNVEKVDTIGYKIVRTLMENPARFALCPYTGGYPDEWLRKFFSDSHVFIHCLTKYHLTDRPCPPHINWPISHRMQTEWGYLENLDSNDEPEETSNTVSNEGA